MLKYCAGSNHKILYGDEPLVMNRLARVCNVPSLSINQTSEIESLYSLEHFLAPFAQGSLTGLFFSLASGLHLGLECGRGT